MEPADTELDEGITYETLPPRPSPEERNRLLSLLYEETVGGMLLVIAAVIAIVWANSPWASSYFDLRDFRVGIESLGLNLSLGQWASDGLLAIFFFMVGLELKREFAVGDLRKVSTAIVPVTAAAGGVIVPALIFTAVTFSHADLRGGWAIPTATDIAFAVSVLALIGSHLPSGLRIFLLTLAVVDDLIAIGIIAVFYTTSIHVVALLLAFVTIAIYGLIAQKYRQLFAWKPLTAWTILLPIGVIAWAFMHASGIHATIAGVLLAFTVPVKPRKGNLQVGPDGGLAGQFEDRFGPLSTGFAVPLFAFFSAGVAVGGMDGYFSSIGSTVAVAIMLGLVVGKPIGITLTTWVMTRFGSIRLDPEITWFDLFGVGVLAGVGFTVSLLVAELSFAAGSDPASQAKVGILSASLLASLLAAIILLPRNRYYKRKKQERLSQEKDA